MCHQPQVSLKNGAIHGVEALCRRQIALLKQHYYHVVQGDCLAQPLPPEKPARWLEDWEPPKIFG